MGAKRLGGNDQGGKRLGGETTRGGNGLGAKRPGFVPTWCETSSNKANSREVIRKLIHYVIIPESSSKMVARRLKLSD